MTRTCDRTVATITDPPTKSVRLKDQKRREGAQRLLDEFVDRVETVTRRGRPTVATIQEIR